MALSVMITLGLGAALRGAMDGVRRDRMVAEVSGALDPLLGGLGIPAPAQIDVTAGDAAGFALAVQGRPLTCSTLARERRFGLAGVAEPVPPVPGMVFETWVEARRRDGNLDVDAVDAVVIPYVATAVAQTVAEQPQALVSEATVTAWLEVAGDQENGAADSLVDLTAVLRQLLTVGVAVSDHRTILAELRRGRERGRAPDDVAESLIAALRRGSLLVEVAPGYAADLLGTELPERPTGDAPVDETPLGALVGSLVDVLFHELGVVVPPVRFATAPDLPPRSFAVRVNDVRRLPWVGLEPDQRLVNEPVDDQDARATRNPANHGANAIVGTDAAARAEERGVWTGDPSQYWFLAMVDDLRRCAGMLIDVEQAEYELTRLTQTRPEVVKALLGRVSIEQWTRIQRRLLGGGVSIRDLEGSANRVIGCDYVVADPLSEIVVDDRIVLARPPTETGRLTVDDYTAGVRKGKRSELTHRLTRGSGTVSAYLLDAELERSILEGLHGTRALGAPERDGIRDAVRDATAGVLPEDPATILTPEPVASFLRDLLTPELAHIAVAAYDELLPDVRVDLRSRITLTS